MNLKRKLLRLGAAVAVAGLLTGTIATQGVANTTPTQMEAGVQGRLEIDPTPPDVTVPAPFLKMFFGERDARNSVFVTNGYFEWDEIPIMGIDPHAGLDFSLVRAPDYGYGKPVFAGGPGRAYRSYQRIPFEWPDPKTGVVHNMSIGGLLVEVRYANPDGTPNGWVAQFFHFSAANPELKYLPPVANGDGNWYPGLVVRPDAVLWDEGTVVAADTIIGYIGNSGLNKDCVEQFNLADGTVSRCASWDMPHLHVQLYKGRDANLRKQNIIDPLGHWSQVIPGEWTGRQADVRYNPYTPKPGAVVVGIQQVFVTDSHGRVLFAAS